MIIKNKIWVLVAFLLAVTEMATDIHAPNLPLLCEEFGISPFLGNLTISINLVCLALSGLVWGAISDARGRRGILLLGLFIFIIGTLGSFLSPTFSLLLTSRVLQGLGGGAVLVVGNALLYDVYGQGKDLNRVFALCGSIVGMSPGIAPFIGALMGNVWNWRGSFALLLGIAIILWFITWRLAPHSPVRDHSLSLEGILSSYRDVFSNQRFRLILLIKGFVVGSLWVELSGLPYVFINEMGGVPLWYGLFMLFSVGVYTLGAILNSKLLVHYSALTLLKIGVLFNLITVFMFIVAIHFGVTHLHLKGLFIMLLVLLPGSLTFSFMLANLSAMGIQENEQSQGGVSAAIIEAWQSICAGISTLITGYMVIYGVMNLAILLVTLGIVIAGLTFQYHHIKKREACQA